MHYYGIGEFKVVWLLSFYYKIWPTFQFERDKKSKGSDGGHSTIGHTIGLEEVLSSLSTSEFLDEQVINK